MSPLPPLCDAAAGEAVLRLTSEEVCRLARVSRATLWRRVAQKRLPAPIDHGRQALFDRAAVIQALTAVAPPEPDAFAVAVEQRLAALRRRHQKGA